MKLYFTKFKFTENLFSKSLNSFIEVNEDSITVSTVPYLTYSGVYKIIEVQENRLFGIFRYVTQFQFQIFYIDISKGGKKVDIFNDKKEGVILKQ